MKQKKGFAAALLLTSLGLLSSLSACDDIGQALGMARARPDDGKIATEQPLALPPDYKLKPPRETPKDQDAASDANPASTDPDLEKHH